MKIKFYSGNFDSIPVEAQANAILISDDNGKRKAIDIYNEAYALVALAISLDTELVIFSNNDHVYNGARVAIKHHYKSLNPDSNKELFIDRNQFVFLHYTTPEHFEEVLITSSGRDTGNPEGFFDQWEKSLMLIIGW